ncbi:signal peptidase II [Candidatus Pelagibacter sp.]|nr:signal peptidase II [Candidatus Pelagibacter sp.]
MLKFSYKNLFIILFFIIIFSIDRISKIYILNLFEVDQLYNIYINSFLNINLIWNTGIGFGLFSSDTNLIYNSFTLLIILINIIIIIMIFKSTNYYSFLLIMILGGSMGNLFDRIYYKAVPDFIDLHYNDFHWFVFNIADIFITIGVVCLILVELILDKKKD